MKVGINLELMEDVLKEPLSIRIGTGGGVPDTASTESTRPGTVGGGRRSSVEYEKAPWMRPAPAGACKGIAGLDLNMPAVMALYQL